MSERDPVLFRRMRRRRNADAVERTLRALREAGRLAPEADALVAVTRTLAARLDEADKPYVAATVARVELEAIRLLTAGAATVPDELDAFLASLGSAAVGDAEAPG